MSGYVFFNTDTGHLYSHLYSHLLIKKHLFQVEDQSLDRGRSWETKEYLCTKHGDNRNNIVCFDNGGFTNWPLTELVLMENLRILRTTKPSRESMWAALHEKVPNVLSRCHTKRRTGARGHARPSFGMTPEIMCKPNSSLDMAYY